MVVGPGSHVTDRVSNHASIQACPNSEIGVQHRKK
jgi:hypothetical protein